MANFKANDIIDICEEQKIGKNDVQDISKLCDQLQHHEEVNTALAKRSSSLSFRSDLEMLRIPALDKWRDYIDEKINKYQVNVNLPQLKARLEEIKKHCTVKTLKENSNNSECVSSATSKFETELTRKIKEVLGNNSVVNITHKSSKFDGTIFTMIGTLEASIFQQVHKDKHVDDSSSNSTQSNATSKRDIIKPKSKFCWLSPHLLRNQRPSTSPNDSRILPKGRTITQGKQLEKTLQPAKGSNLGRLQIKPSSTEESRGRVKKATIPDKKISSTLPPEAKSTPQRDSMKRRSSFCWQSPRLLRKQRPSPTLIPSSTSGTIKPPPRRTFPKTRPSINPACQGRNPLPRPSPPSL